ncbi:MAG: hypothetical protein KQ78_01266 [Candidatus Izimaplasma bacterium HR2]|nr:MAG: hypothetical protein KQ78_01266 [Candidatus Izimaplasma bacterium HR2]
MNRLDVLGIIEITDGMKLIELNEKINRSVLSYGIEAKIETHKEDDGRMYVAIYKENERI